MPTHDIIDNRKEKLVCHINRILSRRNRSGEGGSPPQRRITTVVNQALRAKAEG